MNNRFAQACCINYFSAAVTKKYGPRQLMGKVVYLGCGSGHMSPSWKRNETATDRGWQES